MERLESPWPHKNSNYADSLEALLSKDISRTFFLMAWKMFCIEYIGKVVQQVQCMQALYS